MKFQQTKELETAKKKAVEEAFAKAEAHKKVLVTSPSLTKSNGPTGDSPVTSLPLGETVTVGSYRFLNRLVPDAPGFLKDESKVSMIVQTDAQSNSWVWIGSSVLGSQILDLAKTYDREQTEMDLDFVLVLVNAEKLHSRGLSFMYSERASWLNAFSLTGDAGSLRFSAGGVALDLSLGDTETGLTLLSQPVIRCLDGAPWKFSTDSNVPVPKSEVVDSTVRQSVEFRPVGFGLDGVVRVVGDKILLTVRQRNGSIAPSATSSGAGTEVPTFNDQILETTCQLGFLEWSVLGGIQVDREELRKGLFRNSLKVSSDYLVVFVRPRAALEAPPRAVPVSSAPNSNHPLLTDDLSLLPPLGGVVPDIILAR